MGDVGTEWNVCAIEVTLGRLQRDSVREGIMLF